MLPQEPVRLGEYSLLEKLGQGGMAQVYRAERVGEAGFKKKVAIKRMLPVYRRDASLLERFAAEARTNARLDHPNLVQVLDFGIEPEPYLVMEFVEGVTLAALLQRLVDQRQQLEISAACFIGAEAAQGLDHAHRKRDDEGNPLGIVHRDVSPQNCLLSNEGAVKVSDFGLVKAADNVVQTGSGVPIGKMSYMAPEQADHVPVDARADVFSLGIVVWEMLTMRTLMPPNDPARSSMMLQACEFQPPSVYNPRVSPQLDQIVMRCLTKEAESRTPSAQALSMQLREVLHELAPGYGRDQLARLLGWAFPENGWSIDEPHETAAQPSLAERMSMMPQPAAAELMQRASMGSAQSAQHVLNLQAHAHAQHAQAHAHAQHAQAHAHAQHAQAQHAHAQHAQAQAGHPAVTGPHPAIPQVTAHPAITGPQPALGAHPAQAGQLETVPDRAVASRRTSPVVWILLVVVLGLVALGVLALAVVVVFFALHSEPALPVEDSRVLVAPSTVVPGLWVDTSVPRTRVYLGERDLGVTPVHVIAEHLDGAPLVALAPGHQPQIVAADELAQAVHDGRGRHLLSMAPSADPDRAIYVRYPLPATIRLEGTETSLGTTPGLVIVPRAVGAIELVEGASVRRLALTDCVPSLLCVRDVSP